MSQSIPAPTPRTDTRPEEEQAPLKTFRIHPAHSIQGLSSLLPTPAASRIQDHLYLEDWKTMSCLLNELLVPGNLSHSFSGSSYPELSRKLTSKWKGR